MKIVKKLNEKMVAVETGMQAKLMQIANKLKEQNGVDVTTEKGGWIIAILIVVGSLIYFINKFFPTFFESIGNKLMEMFNLIKFS